jgi:uncharacterized protein (TIGR02145 family)
MFKFFLSLIGFFQLTTLIAQQVANIRVTQEVDNVVITYDLTEGQSWETFNIEVTVSDNRGQSFLIIPKSLTGDLMDVTAGNNKKIIWDVLNDREELTGDGFVFKLSFNESFSGTFTDYRDEEVYIWIKIGKQIWMAENLAYLPAVSRSTDGSNTYPKYYVYGYEGTSVASAKNNANYAIYAVLYNWNAAKTACPLGWHLPTDYEWTALTTFLGGESIAGGKMKEAGMEHWDRNTDATNESGFSALPGAYKAINEGGFYGIEGCGDWWSSTEHSSDEAWLRSLSNYDNEVQRKYIYKLGGFSVRCIRDN